MSYLLRHGAVKEGLEMSQDGFIRIDDLLKHKNMNKFSIEQILETVEKCPKKRFFIKTESNTHEKEVVYIRANQGHSMQNIEIDLIEIKDSNELKTIIHGTYYRSWDQIKVEGLSKMERQHIHFSTDMPGSDGVISGMRGNCQVAIFINLEKALNDGIKFFKSENNVILCPGNETGFLLPKYFEKVLDIKKNIQIL